MTTSPELPENKIVTNYVGLMLTTRFQPPSSYTSCSWVAQSIDGEISFLDQVSGCFNSSNCFAEVQCAEDNNGIITTLHITSELNKQTHEFSVRCTILSMAPVTIATRRITVAGKNNAII